MTPEQFDYLRKLAFSTSSKIPKMHGMTLDDYVSICLYAGYEALNNFDPSKGAALKTHVINNMRWAIFNEARRVNPLTKYQVATNLDQSLHADMFYLEKNDRSFESRMCKKLLFEKFQNKINKMTTITDKAKVIIQQWSNGRTTDDIAIDMKLSGARVGQILNDALEKINKTLSVSEKNIYIQILND